MSVKTSHLAEQFTSPEQQKETAELGMWVFLATEILFFGALFLALTVYKEMFKGVFVDAARHLDVVIGTTNTAILLTSSLTMALGIQAIKDGKLRQTFNYLLCTAALGILFLGLKGIEYHEDYVKGLFPDHTFLFVPHAKLFFFLYYFMTLLHALHLLIGISLVTVIAGRTAKGAFSENYFTPIEVTGLYWHFVDIVWVFLFPLFLSGRTELMRKTYILIYFALLLLLAITTASAYLQLGIFNGLLNIFIALVKAGLIVVFFMHACVARKPIPLFVAAGFIWLLLLVTITMSDYLSRGAFYIYGK